MQHLLLRGYPFYREVVDYQVWSRTFPDSQLSRVLLATCVAILRGTKLQVYEVLRSCFTAFEMLSWLVCTHSVDSSHFYVEMDPDIWASQPIWVLVIGSGGASGFEDEEYPRPVDSEAYFLGIHFAGAPAKHISREFTSHKTTH